MIGSTELLVIAIAALFLFGPDKLPELAKSLGKSLGDFKKAQRAAEFEMNIFDKNIDFSKKDIRNTEVDDKIKKMAQDAGIDTEGKSTDEWIDMMTEIIKTDKIKQ
ncbi:MAG: twin-arginine translocase TatA/TatE family subunit [Methanosarcinaceae archaeon]|nr:twin-arginine translocase TatA/TatE family subunit [Methanosarcinaceae archaeon]